MRHVVATGSPSCSLPRQCGLVAASWSRRSVAALVVLADLRVMKIAAGSGPWLASDGGTSCTRRWARLSDEPEPRVACLRHCKPQAPCSRLEPRVRRTVASDLAHVNKFPGTRNSNFRFIQSLQSLRVRPQHCPKTPNIQSLYYSIFNDSRVAACVPQSPRAQWLS